jgi:hypothetical protein
LDSTGKKLRGLRRVTSWLIYASVILGVALLAQLYSLMVPYGLFYSILAGWTLYVGVAIAVATGRDKAYPVALVLSIATLAVSLPQSKHYSLAEASSTLASMTFIAGSVLQVGVIIFSSTYLILRSRQSPVKAVPVPP